MPAAERFDVDRAERRTRDALGDDTYQELFASGASEPVTGLTDAVFSRHR